MFGDQLKLSDGATIHLQCAHEFTGGEMKCIHCGNYPNTVIKNQSVDCSEIDWTDGLEYLKQHDI